MATADRHSRAVLIIENALHCACRHRPKILPGSRPGLIAPRQDCAVSCSLQEPESSVIPTPVPVLFRLPLLNTRREVSLHRELQPHAARYDWLERHFVVTVLCDA